MTLAASTITARASSVSLALDSEELATTYDRISTRQFNHGKLLIAALGPRPGERVLDIGCGTGRPGDHVSADARRPYQSAALVREAALEEG